MLRVLTEEDGFNIKQRQLMRVRVKNRWLLRTPNPSDKSKSDAEGNGDEAGFSSQKSSSSSGGGGGDIPLVRVEDLAASPAEHDILQKLVWSNGTTSERKRRRRTRGHGANPADPPGPPRFPSETTIDEARVILGLDNDVYRDIRMRFTRICEDAGVTKKTLAGPERWEAVKDQLVQQTPQLQAVMWANKDDPESKKLALEIICADVTKRIRTNETKMTIAEAKNVLGVNPEESREIRTALAQLLKEDGIMSKSEAGQEQWNEVKRKWTMGSTLICQILRQGEADPSHQEKTRALDVLARDVMKRLRDGQVRREPSKKKPSTPKPAPVVNPKLTPKPTPKPTPKSTPKSKKISPKKTAPKVPRQVRPLDSDRMDIDLHVPSNGYDHISQVAQLRPPLDLVPAPGSGHVPTSLNQLQAQNPALQSASNALSQAQARLMPSVLDPHRPMALDPQLGQTAALLLQADASSAFSSQQYMAQLQAAAEAFGPVPPAPTSIGIYLRLHPSSTFMAGATFWLATLGSQSVHDLRLLATQKWPGALCFRIEGVLKDGKGGEIPVQIQNDDELGAYLAHIDDSGGTPTFNVQLVPGWKTSLE
jgi:hypothetical protein